MKAVIWWSAAATWSCASGDDSELRASDSEIDAPAEETACPPGSPEFTTGAAGLTAINEALGIKARVDEADFLPPRFGINTWVVALTDLNDQALPQLQLTWACAFMPAHGHGSNPSTVEKLDGTRFRLGRQNMSMQGGWEIQLWVDPDGGSTDFTGTQGGINSNSCRSPDGTVATLTLKTCVPRKSNGT